MTAAAPAGTPLFISELSLVVTVLVAFVGPFVVWRVATRQIRVAAREAWAREFREHVAQVLAGIMNAKAAGGDAAAAEIRAATVSYQTVGLLIAEKGTQYEGFMEVMNRLLGVANRPPDPTDRFDVPNRITEVRVAAANILRQERALPGVNAWPPWSRLRTWACGRPHFPT